MNNRLITAVSMMSSYGQTSSLEAYHCVINHFALKMIGFSESGLRSIAVLHYNENAGRPKAVFRTTDEKRFSIVCNNNNNNTGNLYSANS